MTTIGEGEDKCLEIEKATVPGVALVPLANRSQADEGPLAVDVLDPDPGPVRVLSPLPGRLVLVLPQGQ